MTKATDKQFTGDRSAPAAGKQSQRSTPATPAAGGAEDYTKASGRDHPAESEHDHKRQKLNGESAKMAKTPTPEVER
jgi:hypothetical protein